MKTLVTCLYSFSTQFITECNAEIVVALDELNAKYPSLPVWWGALSTTLLISIVPYLVLYLIPLDNSPKYESHLKIWLSLAAGGLLGDAFLHLIPQSLAMSRNSVESRNCVGLCVLSGFISFFVTEKFVRIVRTLCIERVVNESSEVQIKPNNAHSNNNKAVDCHCDCDCDSAVTGNNDRKSTINHKNVEVFKDIKITGYLNLAADLVHNFTDGLAIGSSFLSGRNVGLMTGLAIMVHEVPHEIGDFAVLIKSGMSRKRAMSLQLLTAVGAVTGTLISLSMGTADDQSGRWVLPFTSGGFIYIGTVTIVPELTNQTDLKQSLKEFVALLFGIFIMTLIV